MPSVKLFTSKRERRLWVWTLVLTASIYLTAGIAHPVAEFLQRHDLLGTAFMSGSALVIVTVLAQQLRRYAGWAAFSLWCGVAAIYVLILARIEIPEERTHLIEYGVLAAFIYDAFFERIRNGSPVPVPAILTIGITVFLGLVDEIIQIFIPNRVFDIRDVGFNAFSGGMVVLFNVILRQLQTWRTAYLERKNRSDTRKK